MSVRGSDMDLCWTDEDGARVQFTTDPETCAGKDVAYLCVVAIPEDAESGGVYITRAQAIELRDWLNAALGERT